MKTLKESILSKNVDLRTPIIQQALERCGLDKIIKDWDWDNKTFIIKELQLLSDPLWDFDKFLREADIRKVCFDTRGRNLITLSAGALEDVEFEFRGNQDFTIYCSQIHHSILTTTGELSISPKGGHLYMDGTTIRAAQLNLRECRVMKMKSNVFAVEKVILRQMAGALLKEFEAWYEEPFKTNPLNKLGFGSQMDIRKVKAYGRNSDLDISFIHTGRNEWVGSSIQDEYNALEQLYN